MAYCIGSCDIANCLGLCEDYVLLWNWITCIIGLYTWLKPIAKISKTNLIEIASSQLFLNNKNH